MMIGVAQVIGMKPTFRSFFSGAPASPNASVAILTGKNWEMAASAVDAPTDFKNARRAASWGNIARITADATTPSYRSSTLAIGSQRSAEAAWSCSVADRCWPQTQPVRESARSELKGSSKVDMLAFLAPRRDD
jgi:hypothetical protein